MAKTWEEAYARIVPVNKSGRSNKPEIRGRAVTGYQGWFAAEGDESGLGWRHYGGKELGPGKCSFDVWPDMSEMDEDERYPTKFQHADGSTATLFSSYNPKTVDRHFKWMKEFGIDGVMLQRFGVSLNSPQSFDFGTVVMQNVREGAANHRRTWAMMYDLSGMKGEDLVVKITSDWDRLVEKGRIIEDVGYMYHGGKPLVSVWGVGFNDDRKYGLDECEQLVDALKAKGVAVMLGVPYYWRDLSHDSTKSPQLHEILKKVDIISPWAIGRYQGSEQVKRNLPARQEGDMKWAKENRVSYLPVAFPGFSWRNLEKGRGRDAKANAIPREGGLFLWQQAVEAKKAGAEMIYLAMFDEIDEGTCLFKVSNNPPVGESSFVTYEGLPSDHYLWLSGQIGRLIRTPKPTSFEMPKR